MAEDSRLAYSALSDAEMLNRVEGALALLLNTPAHRRDTDQWLNLRAEYLRMSAAVDARLGLPSPAIPAG